jgi:hypothetical protein
MTEPIQEHADVVDPEDSVDPGEFEDYSEVDSRTVDSGAGGPEES